MMFCMVVVLLLVGMLLIRICCDGVVVVVVLLLGVVVGMFCVYVWLLVKVNVRVVVREVICMICIFLDF